MPLKLILALPALSVVLAWISCVDLRPLQDPQTPEELPPAAKSLLNDNTLFAVYGRAFNMAPVLGRLGTYRGFKDMERDIRPWIQGIKKRHGKSGVIPAVHLIYAMASPCKPKDDCLLYLEGRVRDIAGSYIEPAAKRGWMVILDTQIGRSNPVDQVKRMLDKGYLKHENVAVALDPEFRVRRGQTTPGVPIGTIPASQINAVQQLLDDYVRTEKLSNKKILIVHQFGDPNIDDGVPFMIEDKKSLKTFDNVDLVIDMDGLGKQAIKVVKYNRITDSGVYPFIRFRAIKIFFRNRWEKYRHYDKPPMNLDQIFGIRPVPGGARMETKPDIVIIA